MCYVIVDSVLKHYESQLTKEKTSYLGMTEVQRKRVEELLLEGDLLEVTTDETTQIWQVCTTYSYSNNCMYIHMDMYSNYVCVI